MKISDDTAVSDDLARHDSQRIADTVQEPLQVVLPAVKPNGVGVAA